MAASISTGGTIALGTQSRTRHGPADQRLDCITSACSLQLEGSWQYNDYTYTSGSGPVKAVLSSPVPGSTLTSTSATFNWTAGSGVVELLALCRQQRCGLGQHPLGRRDADLARGDRASGFRHAERPADVLHQQRLAVITTTPTP